MKTLTENIWIPINEKFPYDGERVLIFIDNENAEPEDRMKFATFKQASSTDYWHFNSDGDKYYDGVVTHWMLPSRP